MIHQKMARRGQTAVAVESCSPFRNVRKVLLHQTQVSFHCQVTTDCQVVTDLLAPRPALNKILLM